MATRDELTAAMAARYARGSRAERGRILDEFAAVTGYHRKHAMRVLRAGRHGSRPVHVRTANCWNAHQLVASAGVLPIR